MRATRRAASAKRPIHRESSDSDEAPVAPPAKKALPTKPRTSLSSPPRSSRRGTHVKRPIHRESSDSDEAPVAASAKRAPPTKAPTSSSSSLSRATRRGTSVKRPTRQESSDSDEASVAPPAKRAPPTKAPSSASPTLSDWEREMDEAPSFDEEEETRLLEEFEKEGNSSHQSGLSVTTAVKEKGASMATPKRKYNKKSTGAKKEKGSLGLDEKKTAADKTTAKTPAKPPTRTPADIKQRLSLYRIVYERHEGEDDATYLRRVEELPDPMPERPKATPKRPNVRPVFEDSPPREKNPSTSTEGSSSNVPKGTGANWSVSNALAQIGYAPSSSKIVGNVSASGQKNPKALEVATKLAGPRIPARHTESIAKPVQATNGQNGGPKTVEKVVVPEMDETPILPRQSAHPIRPAHMSRKEEYERRSKSPEEVANAIQRNLPVSPGAPSTSDSRRSRTEVHHDHGTKVFNPADQASIDEWFKAFMRDDIVETPAERERRARAFLTPRARAIMCPSPPVAPMVQEEVVEAPKPRRSARMATPRVNLNLQTDDFGEADSDEDYEEEDVEEEQERKKAEEKELERIKKEALKLLKMEEEKEERRARKATREEIKREQRLREKAIRKKNRELLKAQDQARINQEKEAERTRKKNIKIAEEKIKKEAAAARKLKSFFSQRSARADQKLKEIHRQAKKQARQARADKKQAVPSFNSKEKGSRSLSADGHRKDLVDITPVTSTPPEWLYWTMLKGVKTTMRSNFGKVAKFATDASNLVDEHYFSVLQDPYAKAATLRLNWASEVNWGTAPDADYFLNLCAEEAFTKYGSEFFPLDQSSKPSSFAGVNVVKSDQVLNFTKFLKIFPLRKINQNVVTEVDMEKRIPSLKYFVEKFIFLFKIWKISHHDIPYPRVYQYFLHVVTNVLDIDIGRIEFNDTFPDDEETRLSLVRDLLFWLPLHVGDLTDKIHAPQESFVGLARQLLAVLVDEWMVECEETHEEELQMLYRLQLATLRLECHDVFNEEEPVDPAPFFRPVNSPTGFIARHVEKVRAEMSVTEAMKLPKESTKRKLRRRHHSFSEFKDIVATVEPIQKRRAPRFFDPDPESYVNSIRDHEF